MRSLRASIHLVGVGNIHCSFMMLLGIVAVARIVDELLHVGVDGRNYV